MTETNRESFIFYRSFFEALVGMENDVQGQCLMALADYALNGKEPTMTPEVRMFFTLIKPQIDANNKKYENGCKGGRPKNQTETKTKPKDNQTKTEPKPNDNVNDNVNVYKKENTIKEKRETVEKFLKSFGNQHSVNQFYKNKILISNQLSLCEIQDPDFDIYKKEIGEKIMLDVQKWLIQNKLGKEVDKAFICRQFNNFAQRQKR